MPANTSLLADDHTLTLDMVHQYTYCPRRYHLMYIEGRWDDNTYTVQGRHVHRRVDQLDHVLPDANQPDPDPIDTSDSTDSDAPTQPAPPSNTGDEPPVITRSVPLASTELGISAKLDLVSSAEAPDSEPNTTAEAIPVETKRGKVPSNQQQSWKPQRVQLMIQGLLLREQGYHCDHGVLYFAGSRTRVTVPFTPELENTARQLIHQTHQASNNTVIPPPLEDSPKCNHCSLNGICMPDETLALTAVPKHPDQPQIRRLYPPRDLATPLYVQEQGAVVGKSHSKLIIRKYDQIIGEARLKDVSQLVLCGNIQVSTQTAHLLCEAGIPIVYLSTGHWFSGLTHGQGLRNAYDRAAQFRTADNPQKCLEFARQLVADKAANQRTMLRRNARVDSAILSDLQSLIDKIPHQSSLPSLLGIEGNIAAIYFQHFGQMLKTNGLNTQWDFAGRNRRPPKDPVNALLSFGYAMLAKECTVALISEGLDPWWGFYHQPRHGRPSLALDIMEPLRATVVDSAVVTAINTGMVQNRNFTQSGAGCILQPAGRKSFIRAYESRLDQLVTHPAFEYRCSWRTIIRIQARLLARWLRGDIPVYTSVVTR